MWCPESKPKSGSQRRAELCHSRVTLLSGRCTGNAEVIVVLAARAGSVKQGKQKPDSSEFRKEVKEENLDGSRENTLRELC